MMNSVYSEVSPMMKVPSSDFVRKFVRMWIDFSSIPSYLVILTWMMNSDSSDLMMRGTSSDSSRRG